jgi:hypothetical protein
LQHLTGVAAHGNPFTGSSYRGYHVWGTEEGHHQLVFFEMSTGPVLSLQTFCSEELSLEKATLALSSSSFGTLQTLIVPSSLLETNVLASTYLSLVTKLLKFF